MNIIATLFLGLFLIILGTFILIVLYHFISLTKLNKKIHFNIFIREDLE